MRNDVKCDVLFFIVIRWGLRTERFAKCSRLLRIKEKIVRNGDYNNVRGCWNQILLARQMYEEYLAKCKDIY